jgi:hypothetical protein
VFGALLGIGEQIFLIRQIGLQSFAAGPRAGDRANFHFGIFAAHVNFGRSAHQREAFQFQKEHVRRGIDGARGAIDVHRGGGRCAAETL